MQEEIIGDVFENYGYTKKCKLKSRVGEKYFIENGYEAEIINYVSAKNCTIRVNDDFNTIIKNLHFGNIKSGSVRNRNHKILYGQGYIGYGKYDKLKDCKYYSVWRSMFLRCNDKKYLKKYPSYIGCKVHESWHNMQIFAEWFEENYIEGWHLDKDILVKGNKIYSPETCCFVPKDINMLVMGNTKKSDCPIGVRQKGNKFEARLSKYNHNFYLGCFETVEEAYNIYKKEKESYIKEVAELWKERLPYKVYQALYRIKLTN